MSKSILVIDTPGNCESCPFCRGLNVCKIMKYLKREKLVSQYTVDHQIYVGEKPDWCPLKEFPEKEDILDCLDNYDRGYYVGRNSLIDEILKGENENEQRASL